MSQSQQSQMRSLGAYLILYGYKEGHADTVEGVYLDILTADAEEYFGELVGDLIEELTGESP